MPNQKKTDLEANLFHNSHPNLWTKTKSSKTFLDFFKNGDIDSVYTKTKLFADVVSSKMKLDLQNYQCLQRYRNHTILSVCSKLTRIWDW